MLNIWLLLIISCWIVVRNKAVFGLEVVIYKRLQIWRHNYVISRNEYVIFTFSKSTIILRCTHCNFCLNLHIFHGDMKENVSGCFFLNTVYMPKIINNLGVSKNTMHRAVSLQQHGFLVSKPPWTNGLISFL